MPVSTKDVVRRDITDMLVELPLEALAMLLDWVSGARSEPDPAGYILRRAQADAAHGVSRAAVNAILNAYVKKATK